MQVGHSVKECASVGPPKSRSRCQCRMRDTQRFWGECEGQVGARWEWQGGSSDCNAGLTLAREEAKEDSWVEVADTILKGVWPG